MGRHFLVASVAALFASGCYLSHELDDGGRPLDAGRSDAGRVDAGRDASTDFGTNTCPVGATQSVPCGHCGTALRTCGPDGVFGPPGACTGETPVCGLDMMLLADVTGSHTSVFRDSHGPLVDQLVVPLEMDADVRVGVSAFADYYAGPEATMYGSDGDVPFVGVLEPTHDAAAVDRAIAGIMFFNGGDAPEAEIEGLNDLSGGVPHPFAQPFMCTSGVPGGCWRSSAAWRVILVMTDVASHGLPTPTGGVLSPYGSDLMPAAPTWDTVRANLVSTGTYVYWVVPEPDSSGLSVTAADQAREIARQLGEDPYEAVNVYDPSLGDTAPAIARVRERMFAHFGLRAPLP